MQKVHKLDLTSLKGDVYQWEIADGKPMHTMQKNNQMRRLHLLSKDAWKDKAPTKLIKERLDLEADNKRIIYLGEKPKVPDQEETQQYIKDSVSKLVMDVNGGGFTMPKNKESVKDYQIARGERFKQYNEEMNQIKQVE
jgi:hypothetical protein